MSILASIGIYVGEPEGELENAGEPDDELEDTGEPHDELEAAIPATRAGKGKRPSRRPL